MKAIYRQRLVGVGIVVLLLIGGFFIYRMLSPQSNVLQVSQAENPQTLANHAQEDVITLEPSPTPLPTEITEFPTPDNPGIVVTAPPLVEPDIPEEPIPTAIPTPITTPIPVSAPPFIEGIEAQPPAPFWMYWVQGDEVWRIDGQGGESQLVVDSFATTGQHIAGPPEQGSDCCEAGPAFSVAPDQQKIALVTLDPELVDPTEKIAPEEYATAIHVYDTKSGASLSVGRGVRPIWSPDSKQVAFLRNGGLWVANVETGVVAERISPKADEGMRVVTYAWSPDSTQLTFMYASGQFTWERQIWILDLVDGSEPKVILSRDDNSQDISILGPTWAPDGKSIYYLSSENDGYASHQFQNLWRVSVEDGTSQPITIGMVVGSFGFLPGQPWLYLTGLGVYDFALGEDVYYNIWLMNHDDGTLRRLTPREEDSYAYTHTPDGANLLVLDQSRHLYLLSLADGSLTPLDEQIEANYIYGGAK